MSGYLQGIWLQEVWSPREVPGKPREKVFAASGPVARLMVARYFHTATLVCARGCTSRPGPSMLKGDLSLFSLGEVLQSLAINTHTGTLKITSPRVGDRMVCFQRGDIVYYADTVQSGKVPQIGEILVRMQVITAPQLEEALADQRQGAGLLGEVLVSKGFTNESDLRRALETQTLEGLYALFLVKEGTFEFEMNVLPDALHEGLWKKVPISLNTNSVIMEGLRQVDEWGLINRHIVTFDEIFRRVDMLAAAPTDGSGFLLEMCDGTRSVRDLFKLYPGSRFECCRQLCAILERELIRPLSSEECLLLANEKVTSRQHQQAATYLAFAAQLEGTDGSILETLGTSLEAAFEETAARDAYSRAVQVYTSQEQFDKAAQLGDRLVQKGNVDEGILEQIFQAHVRLQNFKRAASTGNVLVSAYQKSGKLEKAAVVMETVAAMDPDDLNLKIQAATLFEKAGNTELATRELEQVATSLEQGKKYRELVKILRLLSQINPKRQDLKQRISATQALIELLARRRKFRMTVAGISVIALLVFAVLPFLYEVKAREHFSHAQRLEQAAMVSLDFAKAKEAYLKIVKSFYFSTRVAEAQEGLDRISNLERSYLARSDLEAAARKEAYESKMYAAREEFAQKVKNAEAAENAGDMKGAHAIYRQLEQDYGEVPASGSITYPLRVVTDPAGAMVSVDGVDLGKTPYIYRYKAGANITLTLTRPSCVQVQNALELRDQYEHVVKLERTIEGSFGVSPAVSQPSLVVRGKLILISRDGQLYAVNPRSRSVYWHRVVGRHGDRISDLAAWGDDIFLGNVTGEVTAISAESGKPRWVSRVGSSVLAAPAVSPDGRWLAVGATSGAVHIFATANGSPVAKFSTENEILAQPVFVGSTLFVASTDNSLYAYSPASGKVIATADLPGDVIRDLARDGDHLLLTCEGGVLLCFATSNLNLVWSRKIDKALTTAPCISALGAHVGTVQGGVVTFDRKTGNVLWETPEAKGSAAGLFSWKNRLFLTTESGALKAIVPETGAVSWTYQADTSFLAPPLVHEGYLYAAGMNGRVFYLEALE